jgi:hypothetical protein
MIAVRATLALAEGGKKSRTASIGAGAACRNEPITEAALQIAEHGFVPSRCHDGARAHCQCCRNGGTTEVTGAPLTSRVSPALKFIASNPP